MNTPRGQKKDNANRTRQHEGSTPRGEEEEERTRERHDDDRRSTTGDMLAAAATEHLKKDNKKAIEEHGRDKRRRQGHHPDRACRRQPTSASVVLAPCCFVAHTRTVSCHADRLLHGHAAILWSSRWPAGAFPLGATQGLRVIVTDNHLEQIGGKYTRK